MSVHSKILIHWTGRKDINPECKNMSGDLREEYVARLRDICRKGLYMNPGEERIQGINGTWIQAKISRVCFTEIRLSQAKDHAKKIWRHRYWF